MPIDYNFEIVPSFRELTKTGLVLLRQPLARSLRKLRLLRESVSEPKLAPVEIKSPKRFRRSS